MVDVRAVTLEVGCSKFVGRISSTVPLSFLSYNVQEGAAAEQHIIIGTVMAIISHGRFSPSPGSFSSLVGTAGQPAGRERMRMRNGVDWIKSSLRRAARTQANSIFFEKNFHPRRISDKSGNDSKDFY